MKVLHINTNYTNNALHQNMIKSLENKGVECDVVVPAYSFESVVQLRDNEVIAKCFHRYDRVNFYKKQRKIFAYIDANYTITDYDCIHAYTVFTDGNVAYDLHRKYGVPYVVAVRNTDVNTFFKYMMHLRKKGIEILKNARAVFFLCDSYKKRLFSEYLSKEDAEIIEKHSFIIPNGIDQFWLENKLQNKKEYHEGTLNICFAGKINKEKNCRLTVKGCKHLIDNGYEVNYTIIGRIIDKSFQKVIRNNSFITHIPFLPKEELIDFYRKSDVFVMPSHTETFGMVYVEAMSQGLPIVYTRGEGFDGHYPEGTVGFNTSSNKSGELVEAIIKILEDYRNISARCLDCVDDFAWDKITDRYIQIYSELQG